MVVSPLMNILGLREMKSHPQSSRCQVLCHKPQARDRGGMRLGRGETDGHRMRDEPEWLEIVRIEEACL